MEIKLDDLNFQEVFNAALMKTLDDGKKENLIKGAIAHLMTKETKTYGQSSTPLRDAFNYALQNRAKAYIEDFLDKDPTVKEAILSLITDAVKKITTDARAKTVDRIAEKIIEGLYSDKY